MYTFCTPLHRPYLRSPTAEFNLSGVSLFFQFRVFSLQIRHFRFDDDLSNFYEISYFTQFEFLLNQGSRALIWDHLCPRYRVVEGEDVEAVLAGVDVFRVHPLHGIVRRPLLRIRNPGSANIICKALATNCEGNVLSSIEANVSS